jgi:hypothetical protein
MTYTAETRPEKTMTQGLLETAQTIILRKITNKTRKDKARRENIRRTFKVDNVNEWIRGRNKRMGQPCRKNRQQSGKNRKR